MSQSKVSKAFEKLMLSLSPPCAYDDGLNDPEDESYHLHREHTRSGSAIDECRLLRDEMVSGLTLGSITRYTHEQHACAASLGPQLAGLRDDRSAAVPEHHHCRMSSDRLDSSDLPTFMSTTASAVANAAVLTTFFAGSGAESSHCGSGRRRHFKSAMLAA